MHLVNPLRNRPVRLILFLLITILLVSPGIGSSAGLTIPSLNLSVEKTDDPGKVAVVLEIVALLTILSLAPAILVLMTSFTRIVIVFHFLRQAIGTQQSPPNQILIGLSLFLTFFIMTPVWQNIYQNALRPYLEEKMTYQEAFTKAQAPLRKFMLKNTREKDLALFVKASKVKRPQTPDDLSLLTLTPAFVISELKTAFIIGFVLYIPFLIIDMVVASVLLSMGMMMLPPIMISLPFKLMLFVLVDGWHMVVGSMLNSFGMFMI
ncbi:MAG: flagellar biosynthetic protein FliP [Desulfobacterium sp.]|nr:flagellar biosynthetic protein FliP [Desulfobacterium sp.]